MKSFNYMLVLQAVLAAIVLAALKGLFKQFTVLVSLWKISKIDWVRPEVSGTCSFLFDLFIDKYIV